MGVIWWRRYFQTEGWLCEVSKHLCVSWLLINVTFSKANLGAFFVTERCPSKFTNALPKPGWWYGPSIKITSQAMHLLEYWENNRVSELSLWSWRKVNQELQQTFPNLRASDPTMGSPVSPWIVEHHVRLVLFKWAFKIYTSSLDTAWPNGFLTSLQTTRQEIWPILQVDARAARDVLSAALQSTNGFVCCFWVILLRVPSNTPQKCRWRGTAPLCDGQFLHFCCLHRFWLSYRGELQYIIPCIFLIGITRFAILARFLWREILVRSQACTTEYIPHYKLQSLGGTGKKCRSRIVLLCTMYQLTRLQDVQVDIKNSVRQTSHLCNITQPFLRLWEWSNRGSNRGCYRLSMVLEFHISTYLF